KQSKQLDKAQIDLVQQNYIQEKDVKIVQFNQLLALDIDKEIGSEEENKNKEIDKSIIK
ncbi:19026_t:CDS:1, partial [Racocetra persica]